MNADRQKVYEALDALASPSWLFALSAMRGVINAMGQTVMPDPTHEDTAVAAIDAEIARLEMTQGR